MYVCGITPYDATHLGHAATYLAFDLVQPRVAGRRARRALRAERHRHRRPAAGACRPRPATTGSCWRCARPRCSARTWRRCGCSRRRHYVGAVESIGGDRRAGREAARRRARVPARRRHRRHLLRRHRDHAVRLRVRVRRADDAELLRRARRRPDRAGKRDPLDALLWRGARDGEPSWPSALGPGRPGWHVECAAIALNRLGMGRSTSRAAAPT